MVLHAVHVLARTVEVLGGHLAARGERVEDVAEDILPLFVLVGRIVALAALHAHRRVAARHEQARREVDLPGGLHAPHGHHAHERGIRGVGREVEPRTGQILDIGGDALTVDAVHEHAEPVAALDRAAQLHAPPEERRGGILRYFIHVRVAEHGRSAEVAAAVGAPGILQVHREVGYALVDRLEVLAVGGAHARQLGGDAEGHVPAGERHLVADQRREVEIIGVRPLEVDGRGGGRQVAEGRHVASEGQPLERHVGRTQAGRVASLGTAAEVGVHVDHHAPQRPGVGNGLQEEARGRGVHHQLLLRIVIARNRDVVGHEVDVVDDAVEIIAGAQRHEAAHRERETVVLRGEYELGLLGLLEAGAVRVDVVLRGVADGHAVACRSLLCRTAAAVVDGIHLVYGDEVDRRRIVAATAFAPVVLGGSGSRKEQGDNQKSKCFHKPNKIWFFG